MNTAQCINKMINFKLIAFDLDGVLVDGPGSWFAVHLGVGTFEHSKKHGKKFYKGELSFDDWARKDAELWKDIDREKIKEILYRVELMKGAEETVSRLKESGCVTAIISGGLQILADRVKEELGMDYAYANRLVFNDKGVEGVDQIVDFKGKGSILKKIADDRGIDKKDCAAIGDYINDIPLFKAAGYSIAFNPKDEEVVKYADKVVYEKDLTKILPLLGDGQ